MLSLYVGGLRVFHISGNQGEAWKFAAVPINGNESEVSMQLSVK